MSDSKQVDVLNDEALNAAGWAFVNAMPYQLPGPIFNNVKLSVKAAIEKWIEVRSELATCTPAKGSTP